ncbi:MAG: hypothetical protein JXA82_17820 [Sedimentisphaerales bacterium]|nr:hypothetical protein [Sedimentisphaerales bacterium]
MTVKPRWFWFSVFVGMAVLVVMLALRSRVYRPIYFPQRENPQIRITGPEFASIEKARQWIHEQVQIRLDTDWSYMIQTPEKGKAGIVWGTVEERIEEPPETKEK